MLRHSGFFKSSIKRSSCRNEEGLANMGSTPIDELKESTQI